MKALHILLVIALAGFLGGFCHAQQNGVLTVLHDFSCGADGGFPYGAGLVQGSDGNFYGVTADGGNNMNCFQFGGGCGTIYKITPQGTLTTLYNFTNGADGRLPLATLVEGTDGAFYGTSHWGGNTNNCRYGCGAVWKITPEGTLTVLHNFNGADGARPSGPLLEGTDGNFYGTTAHGGLYDPDSFTGGTVFKITPQGTLTTLHYFGSQYECGSGGSQPMGPLAQGVDGDFYGVTMYGGTNCWNSIEEPRKDTDCRGGCGVAFKISSDGTFTELHDFDATEGGHAYIGLIRGSDGNFYGTSYSHGPRGAGSVWKMTPSGTVTVLHGFRLGDPDGFYPESVLVEGADGALYGTASTGGNRGCVVPGSGTIFRVSTAGRFSVLYKYTGTCDDGASPTGALIIGNDGHFYGTTVLGGLYLCGTVFRLGCTVALDSTGANFSPAGGSGTVAVTSSSTNCEWTAVSNDAFITITGGGSGLFTGAVEYSVAPNISTSARAGSVRIGQETYSISQSGIPCVVAIDSTNASFGADAGWGHVTVIANGTNCGWTAKSNADWIRITSGSSPCPGKVCPITPGLFCGCANGVVSYAVDANTNPVERMGTVSIAGQTYTVTQAAGPCIVTLIPTSATIGARGGSNTIHVAVNGADCAWTAVSNNPFITITEGSSGTGRGSVRYVVAPNTSAGTVTGTITIADQTFTVLQHPFECAFSLKPKKAKCKAAGGSKTVKVKTRFSECKWTAVSNDPFITITAGASGAGNGVVRYTVAANTNTVRRAGTMSIAGQTFTLIQAGAQ